MAHFGVGSVILRVGNQFHARDPNAAAAIPIATANDFYVFALVFSGFVLVIELIRFITRNLQNKFACVQVLHDFARVRMDLRSLRWRVRRLLSWLRSRLLRRRIRQWLRHRLRSLLLRPRYELRTEDVGGQRRLNLLGR